MAGSGGWDARGGCCSAGNAAVCLSREAREGDISIAVSSCASGSGFSRALERIESQNGELKVAGDGAEPLFSLLGMSSAPVARADPEMVNTASERAVLIGGAGDTLERIAESIAYKIDARRFKDDSRW